MPHDRQRDGELMSRLAGGDSAAMEELIERWQRPLLSFIYRYIQEAETAQELVQETFIRVYRAREKYDSRHNFSGWVFRIAANLARNQLRWRRRHPEVPLEAEATQQVVFPLRDEAGNPRRTLVRHESHAALRRAIATMPHTLKTALLLHYFEELPYREIAAVLGCSERGVESRLYRARKWLSQRLPEASTPERSSAAPTAPGFSVPSKNLLV